MSEQSSLKHVYYGLNFWELFDYREFWMECTIDERKDDNTEINTSVFKTKSDSQFSPSWKTSSYLPTRTGLCTHDPKLPIIERVKANWCLGESCVDQGVASWVRGAARQDMTEHKLVHITVLVRN